jgi:hypothetical protein
MALLLVSADDCASAFVGVGLRIVRRIVIVEPGVQSMSDVSQPSCDDSFAGACHYAAGCGGVLLNEVLMDVLCGRAGTCALDIH